MADFTYKNKQWVDDATGKPATPDQVKQIETHLAVKQVRTPAEAVAAFQPSTIAQGLERNLPPIATQMSGEEVGAMLGGAVGGPPGVAVGGVLGAGAGGLASKYFPQRFGGSPEESALHAFALPAIGSAIARGAGAGVESYSARKVRLANEERIKNFAEHVETQAKEAHGRLSENIPTSVSQANVNEIGRLAGRQPYSKDTTGTIGRQETFQARDATLGPIDRRREKLGGPIGAAYKALKDEGPISEQEAVDLADAAQNVHDELIAPAPRAAAAFAAIKRFRPPTPEVNPATGEIRVRGGQIESSELPSGVQYSGGTMAPELGGIKPETGAAPYKPPTPDDLRELRQQVNTALRTTTDGPSQHALRNLQQALDEHLMPRLPANIRAQYADYAHFMKNYPWRDIRTLNDKGTAEQIRDWLFNSKSPQAIEVIRQATPEEREVYKRMYASRLFDGVNDRDLPEKQMAQIRKNASDDMQNGVVRELYGPRTDIVIDHLSQLPVRAKRAAEIWQSPAIKRRWNEEFARVANSSGKVNQRTAETALRDLVSTLSPDERKQFLEGLGLPGNPPLPIVSQPLQLESTQAALQREITTSANAPYKGPIGRMTWAIPMAIGSLVMGRSFGLSYGIGTAAVFAAGAGGKSAYRWIINHGGAETLSRAYQAMAAGNPGTAARLTFQTLAQIGARAEHERERNKAIEDEAP